MVKFIRWLVAAVFVSFVIGMFAGGISGWNARRVAEQISPNRPSVYFQELEDEVIWRVFYWTAGGVFVFLIFAARVKLPAATKDIAWGVLAGAVVAVVLGNLISTLRGEPGTPAKNYPETIRLTLLYGLPFMGILGAIAGYVRHRMRKHSSISEVAGVEATAFANHH